MPLEGAPGSVCLPAREADQHAVVFILVDRGVDLDIGQDQQQDATDETPFQRFPHDGYSKQISMVARP
ncbi:hypothetical protein D3C86_2218690 [compost metagenome]